VNANVCVMQKLLAQQRREEAARGICGREEFIDPAKRESIDKETQP
jgi:hypothetical protein